MAEQNIDILKADGTKEPFNLEKLEHSLRHAKTSPQIIQKVTSHILQEIEDGMSTSEIYEHAFELLHKFERASAIRYSLRRALLELGPSGFPFERFVAELFKFEGYKTLTDQMVKGFCAEHEIDVVAWKNNSLIMSEVKFHNQPGIKSDLKVVLYVKARFEDLSKVTFKYDGQEHSLTDGWLVTNTKFTISALKYAECQNLKIISWNYPLDGNLQDMIEAANLHPLTCLRTLSTHDKKSLLQAGVVLCKTLIDDSEIMTSLGLTAANIEAVREEVAHIYG
jgi:hypothetical protein